MPAFARIALSAAVGGVLGYGYHRLAGCSTGACPLTATPLRAILYGSTLGLLFSLMGRQ
jgi:Family of unknown function (DUF6132)